jgi:glycerol-3-phosphate dehydrogenase (NAD(P)+)
LSGTASAIGVLGAGSWGTALAVHCANAGLDVRLWGRCTGLCTELARSRENREYLPGVELPERLGVTAELADLGRCRIVLVVVPSHGYREVLRRYLAACPGSELAVVVSCTKGIESETLARMSQVSFEEAVQTNRELRFAVLSGPTFAAELATGTPTAAVLASEDDGVARELQDLLSWGNLRLYTSSDVVGVEIGGTAKNVVAIAAGAVTGLGFGHNTLAALITRGLHEVTRLGLACGGRPRTFSGLAGLGDLVLTCTGGLSRNRRTGLELAGGKSLDEIAAESHMVAEGVLNSRSLLHLARLKGIEMPITEQMEAVLWEGKTPRAAVADLMQRELKAEAEL